VRKKKTKKLVIFTTLFESKMGGIKDLLAILGKEKEVERIHSEFQRRKIFGPGGLKKVVQLYKGLSEDKLRRISLAYCQQNLLPGIREAVTELKKKGFLVGVLSSNPQFMMDILKETLSLDFAIGTQLEFKRGIATGRIQKEVNRYTKAKILKMKRKEYKIDKENVIVIGRSSVTHLPMAKEAGISIGFNPEEENIADITGVIATDKNLRKVFFGEI
jgi:phosphoserine phosphatase